MCRNSEQNSDRTVIAYDINITRVERLKKDEVQVTSSLEDTITATDIVFLSLPGEAQASEVVPVDNGILSLASAGQIIVDYSICPVHLAQEISTITMRRKIGFLDAPVARGVNAWNSPFYGGW